MSTAAGATATAAITLEEQALNLFASSTINLLTFWPALRLAISQGWGGPTGLTHLAEDIVDLFYTTALDQGPQVHSDRLPDPDDIEAVLLHVLSHEFSLTLEDSSERLIARDLIKLWTECLQRVQASAQGLVMGPGLIETFASAAEKARAEDGVRTYAAQREGESDDESGDDDDDDDDDDMDEDDEEMEGGQGSSSRKKNEPTIDEDGFELVTKGSRR